MLKNWLSLAWIWREIRARKRRKTRKEGSMEDANNDNETMVKNFVVVVLIYIERESVRVMI